MSGRALLALDFEILVIYLPTMICLLICAAKMGLALPKSATGALTETAADIVIG